MFQQERCDSAMLSPSMSPNILHTGCFLSMCLFAAFSSTTSCHPLFIPSLFLLLLFLLPLLHLLQPCGRSDSGPVPRSHRSRVCVLNSSPQGGGPHRGRLCTRRTAPGCTKLARLFCTLTIRYFYLDGSSYSRLLVSVEMFFSFLTSIFYFPLFIRFSLPICRFPILWSPFRTRSVFGKPPAFP